MAGDVGREGGGEGEGEVVEARGEGERFPALRDDREGSSGAEK